ncbi:MAG: VanZ family protein [Gammaproteobacteria bacterium]
MSSMPREFGINHTISNADKFAHAFAFFVLSMLLLFGYKLSKPLFTSALVMALFGLFIEVLQRFVPNRMFSMVDFVADLLGIALALIFFRMLSNKIAIT